MTGHDVDELFAPLPADERERIARAAETLGQGSSPHPRLMIVLGSGLGPAADALRDAESRPSEAVPGLEPSGVPGHAGRVLRGRLDGAAGPVECLVQVGRVHLYEGHAAADVVRPVRVARTLGVQHLLITNAAGGIAEHLHPGTLMAITDQLNLTGHDPLQAPAAAGGDRGAPTFTDLGAAYDPELRAALGRAAGAAGVPLAAGVYAGRAGPSYETPAEVRMLAALGADAVGMSTVLEVIAAVHAGLAVAGLSCITNRAAGRGAARLSHDEVLAVGAGAAEAVGRLLRAFAGELPA